MHFERLSAMPSTVIYRISYQPARKELEIVFTSGRRYLYSQVAEDVAEEFRTAFAKGPFFNHYIRDRYPCREIDPVATG